MDTYSKVYSYMSKASGGHVRIMSCTRFSSTSESDSVHDLVKPLLITMTVRTVSRMV